VAGKVGTYIDEYLMELESLQAADTSVGVEESVENLGVLVSMMEKDKEGPRTLASSFKKFCNDVGQYVESIDHGAELTADQESAALFRQRIDDLERKVNQLVTKVAEPVAQACGLEDGAFRSLLVLSPLLMVGAMLQVFGTLINTDEERAARTLIEQELKNRTEERDRLIADLGELETKIAKAGGLAPATTVLKGVVDDTRKLADKFAAFSGFYDQFEEDHENLVALVADKKPELLQSRLRALKESLGNIRTAVKMYETEP